MLAALAVVVVGCSAEDPMATKGSGGSGFSGSTGGTTGDAAGIGGLGTSGTTGSGGSGGGAGAAGAGSDQDGGCTSIQDESPVSRGAVDIVWIIDNSCSMFDEYTRVKQNIDAFANDIQTAGIDHHVVAIVGAAVIPVISPAGDPAAGTALGMDPTHYQYVAQEVGSNNLMDLLVSTFPTWSSFLRPDAPLHFVAVSDDNQHPPVNLDAPTFNTQMEALVGHKFIYHSIASETPLCAGATAPGTEHYAESDATGGQKLSICQTDWTPLFAKLKDAVITSVPLPCEFAIPAPPTGKTFEKDHVNFEYTADMGSAVPWPRAQQMADCGTQLGWYYDDFDAPTKIELCPAGCTAVSGGGKINIVLGCAPPPVIVPQ